jgi:hypothetical protein
MASRRSLALTLRVFSADGVFSVFEIYGFVAVLRHERMVMITVKKIKIANKTKGWVRHRSRGVHTV